MISKYIKPYAGIIAIVICLIILQSVTELALPQHMSDIVDVGIVQSGVEYSAPLAIRKESMESLFAGNHAVYDYYAPISKGSEIGIDNFPANATEDIYIIRSTENTYIAEAEGTFLQAFKSGETQNKSQAINYIIEEYKAMGVDIASMQNSYILKTGGTMLLIALCSVLAAVAASFNSTRVAAGFARDLRKAVFSRVISYSNKELDKFSTASLITRCTNDVQQLQMFLGMGLRIVIFAPAMGIGAIIRVINTESSLMWILALAVAAIIIIVACLFGTTSKKFKMLQELTDKANKTIRESLNGILVIRAFSKQKSSQERFDVVNTDLSSTNRFITRTMGAMHPLMSLVMNLAIVAIIYYGAFQVEAGSLQVGSIMAFIQYSTHVVMSFLFISMISIFLPRAMVSINRIREVLSCEPSIASPENCTKFGSDTKGLVEFKNVSFKYHDADENVLNNISFRAEPASTTAIIGTTGSGKSTVINLISRLYDVTQGEVLIDGTNVKNVSIEDLRSKISYAPQKGILFSGTVESNIKFAGKDEIDDETMKKAASIAQADKFISERDGQYDSLISQGGSNVSGGQRQRLSIARALAKPAEILIFDDSFSALDYKTDAALRKALQTNLKDKTIILVAQRISTIRNAEKIIVMDEGAIVAEGNHDDLLKTCEIYRQIAYSQTGEGGEYHE